MRYFVAMLIAVSVLFLAFWGAGQLAVSVSQGSSESGDFLAGQKLDRCGYSIDARFGLAGFDLDEWRGSRCNELSALDECLLSCLSRAGAVEIARGCYDSCWPGRKRR